MSKKKPWLLLISLLLFFFLLSFHGSFGTTLNQTQKKVIEEYYSETKENPNLFGILDIPTIQLKNPIYQKGNKENQVDKNVELLKETISEEKNGFVVLAAHSGNGVHAYFKNLDKLKIEDKMILDYQGQKLEYQYFKKEEVPKTGTVYLEKYSFSYLALITCSKTNNKTQEVYYAKLIK